MKSLSPSMKNKSKKNNISTIVPERPQKYISKNVSKKYIYKREKASDTDKVLQNNKLSKNYIFSPIHIKQKEKSLSKYIINNNNSTDLKRPLEMRENMNIDYEQYQKQNLHMKHPSLGNLNYLNNLTSSKNDSNILNNQNYYLLERKNGFMENTNRSFGNFNTNKWKCPQCGNVNSNFNYLCNNCNMPNTSLPNDTLISNPRNNSTGKNIKSFNINNNIINNSFNNNSINNSSNNIFTKSINNNTIMKKQILKKTKTKSDLNSKNSNQNPNNVLSPYYSNVGFNTIRPNKNSNYFYNDPNVSNISRINNINNSISNSSNLLDTERDSNITHLYSYSNYLANELKTSNDANIKLLENYQNTENEYKNNFEQNDLIKKKIKILKEKEEQLDKINAQLENSLNYIHKKLGNKNMDISENNNIIKSFIENDEKNLEEIKSSIKKCNEEYEKLNENIKKNKDIINQMKTKIGELSEEKNESENDMNSKLKQKINEICEIKNDIEQYTKEIKEQNKKFNILEKDNKLLEQKIKMIKAKINEEEINNKKDTNENKVANNTNTLIDKETKEKNKYLKNKEQNSKLMQLLEELNNQDNDEINSDKLKEIYLNLEKDNLIDIMNREDEEEGEGHIIDFIDEYINSLIN